MNFGLPFWYHDHLSLYIYIYLFLCYSSIGSALSNTLRIPLELAFQFDCKMESGRHYNIDGKFEYKPAIVKICKIESNLNINTFINHQASSSKGIKSCFWNKSKIARWKTLQFCMPFHSHIVFWEVVDVNIAIAESLFLQI